MKRLLFLLSVSLIFTCVAALAHEKVEDPQSCEQCGMDRTRFAQSRVVIVFSDGERVGTCSLHCAATEIKAKPEKFLKSLQVADCKSRELIDARTAVWVIGGAKKGVMTRLPKWAFALKEDAEAFTRENGGKLAGFDEAMALARGEQK